MNFHPQSALKTQDPMHESLTHAGRGYLNRRDFLASTGTALGAIAISQLLSEQKLLGDDQSITPDIDPAQPHAARKPHGRPQAKNVLVIFCAGRAANLRPGTISPNSPSATASPCPADPP